MPTRFFTICYCVIPGKIRLFGPEINSHFVFAQDYLDIHVVHIQFYNLKNFTGAYNI